MKSAQLQIRVSPAEKRLLRQRAREAGQTLSAFVLTRLAPSEALRWHDLVAALAVPDRQRFALAALNDLLTALPGAALATSTAPPPADLAPRLRNQVAAMVEQAAVTKGAPAPSWTGGIAPLERPWFASVLPGLRAHLLLRAPTAFRRRNLFVDTTLGGRA